LTGCQGELTNKQFKVYIKDAEGQVILDKMVKSQKNGFIDLWLPRDKKYQIKIEQDGKKAGAEISTFKDAPTCITTMKLM
jgi:hypothetical protein